MTAVHLVGLVLQHIQPTIRGRAIMGDSTIINFSGRDTITDPLTDFLRKGARELLQAAIEASEMPFSPSLSNDAQRTVASGRTYYGRRRMARSDMSGLEWEFFKAVLPNKTRGKKRVDDRRVINGIFCVLGTIKPWDQTCSHRLQSNWHLRQDATR